LTLAVIVLILALAGTGLLWKRTVNHVVDAGLSGKMPTMLPIKIPNPRGFSWTYTASVKTQSGSGGVLLIIVDFKTRRPVQTASNADPMGTAIITSPLDPARQYELLIQPVKGSTEAAFGGTERHMFKLSRHRILDLFR
jgi:hypothetical protein